MKTLVITTDSLPGRTLMALRAGPMTTEQLNERFVSNIAPQLVTRGFADFTGEYYLITEAGRAACPLRNPLAAPALMKPTPAKIEEPQMSRENPITRQEVLEAIQAGGIAGITRKALLEKFNGNSSVDSHIFQLNATKAIHKPEKGLLVATNLPRPEGATTEMVVMKPTSAPPPSTTKPARRSRSEIGRIGRAKSSWDRAPATKVKKTSPFLDEAQSKQCPPPAPDGAPADQPQGSETTAAAGQVEILPPHELAESKETTAPAPVIAAPAVAGSRDRMLANPLELSGDDVDFGIWSDGRLTICDGGQVIEMPPEMTRKLITFLGGFCAEEATV